MKVILIASLLALAMGHLGKSPSQFYHEAVGIEAAVKIKAAEEAKDFSGSRIVGGSPAALGSHPYLAGLLITLTNAQTSVCSGALVSNTRVVTAAHCYFDGNFFAQFFTVVLGSTTLFTGGVRLVTNTVITHPAWNWNNYANNVAVVHITPTEYTPIISNIRIPTDALLLNDFVGTFVQASGFGLTSADGVVGPGNTKHQVWLQVITNSMCQRYYGHLVQPSILCTDNTMGQGPCYGDFGGPLSIVTGGQNVLIGIQSFISQGCLISPAAWTRVTSHAFWIEANL